MSLEESVKFWAISCLLVWLLAIAYTIRRTLPYVFELPYDPPAN
jgi:hypothetical protein